MLRRWFGLGLFCCLWVFSATAFAKVELANAQRHDGYFPLFYMPESGQALMAVTKLDEALLYQTALVSGVGSNDIGLDRGQLGYTRVVRFRRAGNKILLIQDNTDYQARSTDPLEVKAVTEAFATSVLASLEIVAEDEGAPVVDLGPLLYSDSHGIAAHLAAIEQGSFSFNKGRSAVFPEHLLNFPENSIVQVLLSFNGSKPGEWVRQVTPTPERLSVTYLHQFTDLPDDQFTPRTFHTRSGYFGASFRDYAVPLGEDLEIYYLSRHRLQYRDDVPADAATSGRAWPVKEPIVYYLDPGTPEPVRSALLEGASWWADAFEAAGFADAYRVEMLPADAHPLDIRYNVIQWVHRATRGWSYGSSIRDPRTGEIIKGHVTLGSLRVRQDMLIAEALTAPFKDGLAISEPAKQMALARLRQLAAHEVGHTLGLAHNFAASSVGDASVMDYPHPNLYLDDDGNVGIDQAYQVGVSPWDRWIIRYGYAQFPAAQEQQALQDLLQQADRQGFLYASDPDARVPGSAYAQAHLWDNGNDPLQRFDELLAIRAQGLAGFNDNVLPEGRPLFELEQRLVPVYLLHRFQLEAVAKQLGGVLFDHRVRGERFDGVKAVARQRQHAAMQALLKALETEFLRLPDALLNRIPPPAEGYARGREYFQHFSANEFDHLAPARVGGALVLKELLQPARAAHMNDQHLLDDELPDFAWVLKQLNQRVYQSERNAYAEAINDNLRWTYVDHLEQLLKSTTTAPRVRAQVYAALDDMGHNLMAKVRGQQAQFVARRIEAILQNHADYPLPSAPVKAPPGSPIGQGFHTESFLGAH